MSKHTPLSVLLQRARAYKLVRFENRDAQGREKPSRLQVEDILTPEEVAHRLKVPVSWVYEKTRTSCVNPIPLIRIGRYIRFDWRQILEWLEAQSSNNGSRR